MRIFVKEASGVLVVYTGKIVDGNQDSKLLRYGNSTTYVKYLKLLL
jgi:hypothetical protein